jgi:hypothetical protein
LSGLFSEVFFTAFSMEFFLGGEDGRALINFWIERTAHG